METSTDHALDLVKDPFDPSLLEHNFDIEAAGQAIQLQSHQMVFNPTRFGLNLAPLIAERIKPGTKVCEIGIGGGVLCILGGLLGANVTGLDINAQAVHMTRRNWARNDLPEGNGRFMQSQVFGALDATEAASFDLVWSNPPLLPQLDFVDQTIRDREGYEVAGEHGRQVLDGVLAPAQPWLRPGGRAVTIATSVQGWAATEELLKTAWSGYEIIRELELELTDECGPEYIKWWQSQDALDGQERVYQRDGKWLHKVWFLEAWR